MFPTILAEGEVATPGYQQILTTLQGTFTEQVLSAIIVAGVTASAGLILFYWGTRKVGKIFIRAFEKGKLRF